MKKAQTANQASRFVSRQTDSSVVSHQTVWPNARRFASAWRERLSLFVALVCLLAFASLARAQQAQPTPPKNDATQRSGATEAKKSNERPAAVAAATKPEPFDGASVEKMAAQCVTLETDAGAIEIEMLAETAPETARNFLNLAATGALDTTTFNRVVKDFVVQGGNLGTSQKWGMELSQRARRTIPDEPNPVKHVRGIVSMARSDQPNSATTNFFILVGDGSHLDNKFAAFGRVTRGMEVVDAMNKSALGGERGETPDKPVRITRAVVKACDKPKPAIEAQPEKPQPPEKQEVVSPELDEER
jgi:peptidyl-prolyl cis-trans isomerase B (cyclophilin B)